MFSEILRAQIKKVMNFALWFNIHWFSFILACCFMNWNVIIQFRLSWRHSNEEVNDRNIVALILLPFSLKCSLRQLFTRNREIIGAFRERFIFTIIGFFLLFMRGFYTMEPRHVDESSNRTKQRLYWQSIHSSVNIMKIRNFLRSFSIIFVV